MRTDSDRLKWKSFTCVCSIRKAFLSQRLTAAVPCVSRSTTLRLNPSKAPNSVFPSNESMDLYVAIPTRNQPDLFCRHLMAGAGSRSISTGSTWLAGSTISISLSMSEIGPMPMTFISRFIRCSSARPEARKAFLAHRTAGNSQTSWPLNYD